MNSSADTMDVPEKIKGVSKPVRAWRKVASVLRAASDPLLAYHSIRLQKTAGVSRRDHLFVCGIPRAGTSLLATILETNDAVASMKHENAFLRVRNFTNLGYDDLDEGTLRKMGMNSATKADLFDTIADHYIARKPGASRYLDKSPGNAKFLGRIASMFPRGKTIMLVRDPRDGYVSFTRHPGLRPYTIKEYSDLWNLYTGNMLGRRDDPDFFLVSYEEMCSRPEETAQALCEFSGLEYDPKMIDPRAHAEAKGRYSARGGHERIGTEITPKSVGGWRNKLSPEEASEIAQLCAEKMRTLGYDIGDA